MSHKLRTNSRYLIFILLPVTLLVMTILVPAFLAGGDDASALSGAQWEVVRSAVQTFIASQTQYSADGEAGFTIDRDTLKGRLDTNSDWDLTAGDAPSSVLGEGDNALNAPVLVDNLITTGNVIPGTSVRCNWSGGYGSATAPNCFDAGKVTNIADRVNAHEAAGFSTDIVVYCATGRTESATVGGLGPLAQTGALGGSTTPKVLAFKWGRNGWTGATTTLTATTGATYAAPAPGLHTLATNPTPCTAKATNADVVRCAAQWALYNGAGDPDWGGNGYNMGNGVTALASTNQVIDIRTPSPGTTVQVATAPNTMQIPLEHLFENPGPLNFLEARTTGTKNVFVGRTMHLPLIVSTGSVMLGYNSTGYAWGVNSWNTSLGGESWQTGNWNGSAVAPTAYATVTATASVDTSGVDQTAPTITVAPATSAISATSVDITRTANEPATMKVEYGTTQGGPYTSTVNNTVLNANKTVGLSGLTENTKYYVKVTSYDGQANGTASSEISFTTDVTAPNVTGVAPSGNINTTSTTVVVDYNDTPASGVGSGINTGSVSVTLDSAPLAGCTVGATQATCSVPGPLSLGAHAIGGSVADNNGNSSPISGSFTVVDDTPPTVTYSAPTGTINDSTPTITATYADSSAPLASSGIDTTSAEVSIDSGTRTACTAAAGTISCDVGTLGDGAHTAVVYLSDNTPNEGSDTGNFTIDTAAPTVTPDDDGYNPVGADPKPNWTGDTTPTVSATITDLPGGQNIIEASVTFDKGTGSEYVCTGGELTFNNTSVSCTPTAALTEGPHDVEYSAAFIAGRPGVGANKVSVDITPPSITGLAPSGQVYSTQVNITANLTDTGSGADPAASEVYLPKDAVSALPGCTNTATTVSCPATVSLGTSTFKVVAEDNVGNSAFDDTGSFDLNQLNYYLNWFDNNAAQGMKRDDILISNPTVVGGTSAAAHVYIGEIGAGATADAILDVAPGEVEAWSAPSTITDGPIKVISQNGQSINVSQRVIYKDSFNEVQAVSDAELASEYYFTWYDNNKAWGMNGNWVHVANIGSSAADVDIFVGDLTTPKTTLNIAAGESASWQSPTTLTDGPVRVVDNNSQPLVVSERTIFGNAFNEVLGVPASKISDEAMFTWYDNNPAWGMKGDWILIHNLNLVSDALVTIEVIGGASYQETVPAGDSLQWKAPVTLTDGPIKVSSDAGQNILVSQRVIFKDSFEEVQGLYPSQMVNSTDFTWYDTLSIGMKGDWVLMGNTNTGDATVNLKLPGHDQDYVIPTNGIMTPTIPGKLGGPVTAECTAGCGAGQNMIYSHRVIYKNSFNEVIGK